MCAKNAGERIVDIAKRKGLINVVLSSGEELLLSADAFTEFRFYIGKRVEGAEWRKAKSFAKQDSCYRDALSCLSRRPYGENELLDKLKSKGHEEKTCVEVCKRLSQAKLLDDEAYLKEYDPSRISDNEVEDWDNAEVYEQMTAACAARGVPVVTDLENKVLALGNYTIAIYNGAVRDYGKKVGENDNSLALSVTDGRYKVLLMGDVNFNHGVEKAIGRAVGKVDLIKVGHHGNLWSTGTPFLSATKPDIAIFTNVEGGAKFPVEFRLAMTCGTAMYATGEYGGIVAAMEADGIKLYSGIH